MSVTDRQHTTDGTIALTICVYCSSSEAVDERLRALAREVGAAIGTRGWSMVYGGGGVGLMGETARSALAAGAHVTGIIPHLLADRELALTSVSELVRVDTMRQRKQGMDDRADAFLVLPGGIGTLEELIEIMSLRQLGYHDRPVVVLDADGFWAALADQFATMAAAGMLYTAMDDLWTHAHTVDDALDALALARPGPTAGATTGPTRERS